jgi:hypothetical protein
MMSAEMDVFDFLREQMRIDGEEWAEVMDNPLQTCSMGCKLAAGVRHMVIRSYEEQLMAMAEQEKVDLLDAVRNAGINTSVYYRCFNGETNMTKPIAEQLAASIRDLSAR